jgi:hypothetical protein
MVLSAILKTCKYTIYLPLALIDGKKQATPLYENLITTIPANITATEQNLIKLYRSPKNTTPMKDPSSTEEVRTETTRATLMSNMEKTIKIIK